MLVINNNILNVLGPKLKDARIKKGYTQDFLAEKIDMSTDLLRNIENSRNIGSLTTLVNLCNELEISLDYLLSDLIKKDTIGLDSKLLDYTKKLTNEDKKILKAIILYLDKNY